MSNDQAIDLLDNLIGMIEDNHESDYDTAFKMAIKALKQEPCEDAISRYDAIRAIEEKAKRIKNEDTLNGLAGAVGILFDLPPVKQEPKTEQFVKWVATEIFDEMWEYNKDSFAEIACRKLEKLGIVRAKGDEWELVEPQESEDKE
jgi:ATP-dependent protease HslVU (ClpYQ) peptidase subunit